jgi:hypothetical protein
MMEPHMYHNTLTQIEGIHSMLASGHNSVRLEKHTLILWGVTGALLILGLELIINPENFPVKWERSSVKAVILCCVLVAVGILDYRLTQRLRRLRDESLSFVQQQITKVWWLFIALIVVMNLGMDFFGGGYMFYSAVLILLGMAFYTFGLFATQMLSWSGVILIALGMASIVIHPPHTTQKYLAASVLGLGLPVLGFILHHSEWSASLPRRFITAFAWLLICIAPVGLAYGFTAPEKLPENVLTLAQYRNMEQTPAEPFVVELPPGTVIPVHIDVESEFIDTAVVSTVPLTLTETLYISIVDKPASEGQPQYRKKWRHFGRYMKVTEVLARSAINAQKQPEVSVNLKLELLERK